MENPPDRAARDVDGRTGFRGRRPRLRREGAPDGHVERAAGPAHRHVRGGRPPRRAHRRPNVLPYHSHHWRTGLRTESWLARRFDGPRRHSRGRRAGTPRSRRARRGRWKACGIESVPWHAREIRTACPVVVGLMRRSHRAGPPGRGTSGPPCGAPPRDQRAAETISPLARGAALRQTGPTMQITTVAWFMCMRWRPRHVEDGVSSA